MAPLSTTILLLYLSYLRTYLLYYLLLSASDFNQPPWTNRILNDSSVYVVFVVLRPPTPNKLPKSNHHPTHICARALAQPNIARVSLSIGLKPPPPPTTTLLPAHSTVPRCVPFSLLGGCEGCERKRERGGLVGHAEAGSGNGELDARRSTRLRSGKSIPSKFVVVH